MRAWGEEGGDKESVEWKEGRRGRRREEKQVHGTVDQTGKRD